MSVARYRMFKWSAVQTSRVHLCVFVVAMIASRLTWVSGAIAAMLQSKMDPGDLRCVPNSTKKICQLTGDFDRAAGNATQSETAKRFGITATDLGSSFEHNGAIFFLFGDTHGRPGDWDAVGWTHSTDPERIVLDFHLASDHKWLPPKVPGITQGAFEVPSGGVSAANAIYVVFTTDHSPKKVMGRSVLARSIDDGRTFEMCYELSRDKFINVAFWPTEDWLYIYGSGEYRKSSVCLARVKPAQITDRSQLQYFTGNDSEGMPQWASNESDAVPLFRHDVVGEFSVAYLEPVKRYVMLYNSHEPRGITMRSSKAPGGPWSEGTVIFNPWRDGGYGKFMHISAKANAGRDSLSDPNRDNEWGGEYGPYLMARYTTITEGRCRIYFTMSTWNPYQVVVMQSDLELE